MKDQYTIVKVEGWWHVIAPDGEVVFDKATSKEHAEKMLRWLLDQKRGDEENAG